MGGPCSGLICTPAVVGGGREGWGREGVRGGARDGGRQGWGERGGGEGVSGWMSGYIGE